MFVINPLLKEITYVNKRRKFKRKSNNTIQRRSYYQKSLRSSKKVRELMQVIAIAKEIEPDFKTKKVFFVTITTCQHKTGKTDRELYTAFHKWVKNRKFIFLNIVERQKSTKDLHFHAVVLTDKDFRIREELSKLSRLLGTPEHPSLFDVSRIGAKGIQRTSLYITKYITKQSNDPDLNIFYCRTFSYAKRLGILYKTYSSQFVKRVGHLSAITTDEYIFANRTNLTRLKVFDHCVKYKYFDYLVHEAEKSIQEGKKYNYVPNVGLMKKGSPERLTE